MLKFTLLLLLVFSCALAEDTINLLDEQDATAFSEEWAVNSVEWRMFRTSDNHVIAELSTTIEPHGAPMRPGFARFTQPRVYDGPEFDAIDVTDCLEDSLEHTCTQHWYLRSTDALDAAGEMTAGSISVMVEASDESGHYTLHYRYEVEFDAEAPGPQSLLTVDNMPYIRVAAENNGSIIEGQEMCVTMRDNRAITPVLAMLCASTTGDLRPEDGCDNADTTLSLFNTALRTQDSHAFLEIRRVVSDPTAVQVCYNNVKIGPYNQLVKVDYEQDGTLERRSWDLHDDGVLERRWSEHDDGVLQRRDEPHGGSFTHSSHSSCQQGHWWDSHSSQCTSNNDDVWIWIGVGVVLLIICCVGGWCVYAGSDGWGSWGSYGDYGHHDSVHPMTMGHGPPQSTRTTAQQGQQQQQRGHVIVYNKNVHNFDDQDRYYSYRDDDQYYTHNE